MPAGTQNALLIKGQLVSIDEGNRTERVIIGLGAGRSDVRAQVRVYEVTATGSRLIDQIEVDGKSGLTPGMAETMGAGGLAGHLLVSAVVSGGVHVASEAIGADVVADADRAAKGIAKQLATLFAQQGWSHGGSRTEPPRVRPPRRPRTKTAIPMDARRRVGSPMKNPSTGASPMYGNSQRVKRVFGGLLLVSGVACFAAAGCSDIQPEPNDEKAACSSRQRRSRTRCARRSSARKRRSPVAHARAQR